MAQRILIVDDSSSMRAYLRASLEASAEAEVTEAAHGLEALPLLARDRYDFIILDLNMPHMTGFEVARFVRASEVQRNTPILMISTESSAQDRARGLRLGASEHLAKPFTSEQLLAVLGRMQRAKSAPAGSRE